MLLFNIIAIRLGRVVDGADLDFESDSDSDDEEVSIIFMI